jgi:ppGpp synthetase/RelA/SpoT-type nucleotidyltranferase
MTPDKDLELDAYRAREGAEVTLAQLLYLFQAPAISSVFYAVKGRVKTVVGILDKVNRKRSGQNPRPDYCPTDITDVVGIRVITLFRDDIIEALKIVLKLIKQHTPSPFIKDKLHEAIIYTSVAEGDPEAINARVKDVLKAFGYSDICVVRQAPTQYSSIHLLAFCPREGEREIAVEIQIRTVFEDAWGEIDHKLRYSNDRGHAQTERMNWQPHLGSGPIKYLAAVRLN